MTTTTLAPNDAEVAHLEFEPYRDCSESELGARIRAAKSQLGESLLILGHHYQQDEVIRFADLRGDSYKLSQLASESGTCRAIVFCGVHFMAETADILSRDEVAVYLPDLGAGCSMADMADLESVEAAWEDLSEWIDTDDVMPVTYINSSADLKAFCGRHGGIVCTSSNARAVLDWSFARRRRVLFFPDQHLGRNTARAMGVPIDQMPVWDPRQSLGGNTPERISSSRVLLWKGHCSVHQMFKPDHVELFRRTVPRLPDPGSSRMHDAGRRCGRSCRLHGIHHQDHRGSGCRFDLGHRDRAPPGQSSGPGASRQIDPFSVPHGVHVRDHVPYRSAPPGLVPREPGTRYAGEPDPSGRGDGGVGADGTGADARSQIGPPGSLTNGPDGDLTASQQSCL